MSASRDYDDRPALADFRADSRRAEELNAVEYENMSGVTLEIPETLDANPSPEEETASPGERRPSARDKIMSEIAEKRMRQMDLENAQAAIYDREATEAGLNFPVDEPEEVIQEPLPEPAARQAPQRHVAQPVEAIPTPAPVPGPVAQPSQVRTILVDGHQYSVTQEQADQLASLGMLANMALHSYQQQPEPHRQPEAVPTVARPVIDPETIRDTVKKIQYGGEDDAAAALTGLITHVLAVAPPPPQTQQIDTNAIVQRAVSMAQQQARLEADTGRIQHEYPEIFVDPQRQMLANLNVTAIRQRNMRLGQQQSELDIYREAGNAVYDALGKPRPGSELSQSVIEPVNEPAHQSASNVVTIRPDRGDIIERKRSAPRPTQTIDTRAPSPATPRPPTGSEIVANMRRARGLPV